MTDNYPAPNRVSRGVKWWNIHHPDLPNSNTEIHENGLKRRLDAGYEFGHEDVPTDKDTDSDDPKQEQDELFNSDEFDQQDHTEE